MRIPILAAASLVAALSAAPLRAATLTLADNGATRTFEGVVLRGAATKEGEGLVLQLSLGADAPPHPVALARVQRLEAGPTDSLAYAILLSMASGDFKRFEGVRLARIEGGRMWAVAPGRTEASPIDLSRVVHIEATGAAAPAKADPWTTQISAQAFLVNKRGPAPKLRGYDTMAASAEQGYATAQKAQPSTSQYAALLGKRLPQTRFLGPSGDVVEIDALRDGRALALVVLRGFPGYVCPFCTAQTAALSNRLADFDRLGVRVALVYPGPADTVPVFLEAVREYRKGQELPMPVLFDPELAAVRSLGIAGEVALPTSVLVDADGIVRYVYVGRSHDDRPSVNTLLREAAALRGQ